MTADPPGDPLARDVMLNGESLRGVAADAPLSPRARRYAWPAAAVGAAGMAPVSLAPLSYAFVVLRGARLGACGDWEPG